ncbi:MAG: hypothetical protein EXR54_07870 [Dehalococcoidia bacterium]|nr:hypothetical protein [Dehalococcoidia bacterium]MSQ17462.1 hypothetical protein [Dehalococcoidia bacterium]
MGTRSDYLYARPSFWEGGARIWDFANTLNEYNRSSSAQEADEIAMWMDWGMVGLMISSSMHELAGC